MPMSCSYGICQSNSGHKDKDYMKNVFFIPFPKPDLILEKCKRWVHACGRTDFTVENVTRNTYICTKHFVGGMGPTKDHPDPIIQTQLVCKKGNRRVLLTDRRKLAKKRKNSKEGPSSSTTVCKKGNSRKLLDKRRSLTKRQKNANEVLSEEEVEPSYNQTDLNVEQTEPSTSTTVSRRGNRRKLLDKRRSVTKKQKIVKGREEVELSYTQTELNVEETKPSLSSAVCTSVDKHEVSERNNIGKADSSCLTDFVNDQKLLFDIGTQTDTLKQTDAAIQTHGKYITRIIIVPKNNSAKNSKDVNEIKQQIETLLKENNPINIKESVCDVDKGGVKTYVRKYMPDGTCCLQPRETCGLKHSAIPVLNDESQQSVTSDKTSKENPESSSTLFQNSQEIKTDPKVIEKEQLVHSKDLQPEIKTDPKVIEKVQLVHSKDLQPEIKTDPEEKVQLVHFKDLQPVVELKIQPEFQLKDIKLTQHIKQNSENRVEESKSDKELNKCLISKQGRGKRRFQCGICLCSTSTKYELKLHFINKHEFPQNFQC